MKKWFIRNTRGASTTEYLVLLAGMGVAVLGTAFGFGGDVRDLFAGGDRSVAQGVASAQAMADPSVRSDGMASTPAEPKPGQPVILVFTGTTAKFEARLEPGVYTTTESLGDVEAIDALDDQFDEFRMGRPVAPVAQRVVSIKPDAFVSIDWGPGAQNCPATLAPHALSTPYTCSYTHSGPHTVRIDPAINRLTSFDASLLRIESWGDAPMQSLSRAFGSASALTTLPTAIPATLTNLSYAFTRHMGVPVEVDGWNVVRVRNFAGMFGDSDFNRPLAQWDVSNARNLSMMFSRSPFNQPIGNWNTALVENMAAMFDGAIAFNQPLANWNTGRVTNMSGMFAGAKAFNQDISNWNTSKVADMSWMFAEMPFNRPLGLWNTGNVESMAYMFYENRQFNQDIRNWDTRNLVTAEAMFNVALAFNQDIGRTWSVPRLKDMTYMFRQASALRTDFTRWRPVPTVQADLQQTFQGVHSTGVTGDLRCWNVRTIGSPPHNFAPSPTALIAPKWGQLPNATCGG